jgi:hypothetical protein
MIFRFEKIQNSNVCEIGPPHYVQLDELKRLYGKNRLRFIFFKRLFILKFVKICEYR